MELCTDVSGVKAFGISHVGKVRTRNEDYFYIDPQGNFFILADGMGGHKGGKEASEIAVMCVAKSLNENLTQLLNQNESEISDFLVQLFGDTSYVIFHRGVLDKSLENMGATLCAWIKIGNRVVLAHVGDSRIYVFREKNLFQVTQDHTMYTEHRRNVVLSQGLSEVQLDERFDDPKFLAHTKHILVRNVGISPPTPPDITIHKLLPEDIWLLCSDGLSNKLSSSEISNILLNSDLSIVQKTKILVEAAYNAGGQDNITVVLAELN
jgi:PPM family protein phosphatase